MIKQSYLFRDENATIATVLEFVLETHWISVGTGGLQIQRKLLSFLTRVRWLLTVERDGSQLGSRVAHFGD